jgi:Trypsin-co-occurring domain 2
MEEWGLTEAIAQLRKELAASVVAAKGDPLQFTLGPIEVELQLQLARAAGAKAELKWVVVSVGGDAKIQTTHTHKVKFTLTPQLDGGPVRVNRKRDREPE